jgi:hypothetical protein
MDSSLVERMNQLSEKVRLILEDSENLKRAIAERMARRAAQDYVEAHESPDAPEPSEAPEGPDTSEVSDNSSDEVDYEKKATEPLEMANEPLEMANETSSDDESVAWCCCGRRS